MFDRQRGLWSDLRAILPTWFWVVYLMSLLFPIAVMVGVGYVAVHFIQKFW